ncbi:MAG: hypothetical protein WD690_00950 [Vicinamibacterales bacterium]
MSEHQLNDPEVDAVGQQPAGAFVSEIVPSQIDALQLRTIPLGTLSARSRCDALSE